MFAIKDMHKDRAGDHSDLNSRRTICLYSEEHHKGSNNHSGKCED